MKPNPFDSSDSEKTSYVPFAVKVELLGWKDLFQDWDNSMKVNYILSYESYLKGPALNCFKPRLLEPDKLTWLSDYNLFVSELETNLDS